MIIGLLLDAPSPKVNFQSKMKIEIDETKEKKCLTF